MTRPSDAAIARAFDEWREHATNPDFRDLFDAITDRARAIDAEANESERTLTSADAKERIDAEAKGAVVDPIVRYNGDGSLDEVIGTGEFHMEQMDYNRWWMRLGPHSVWLHAKGKITASIGLNEQRIASAPTARDRS